MSASDFVDAPTVPAAADPAGGSAFTHTAPTEQARVPTREERMRTNHQFQELFRLSHEYQDLLDYMNGALGSSIRCVVHTRLISLFFPQTHLQTRIRRVR